MYTDADLDAAVAEGAISAEAAQGLRGFVARRRAGPSADEEHFRLLTGFNDIFVSIAMILLLVALAWLTASLSPVLGAAAVAATSWGLAEYFTRLRRMALPSILLLASFTGGVFFLGATMGAMAGHDATPGWRFGARQVIPIMTGALLTVPATVAHWRRFHVPITVMAGAVAAVAAVTALVLSLAPEAGAYWALTLLAGGLSLFALAMRWDMSDTARVTRRSDVAFWLHLAASPLIVHPVFALLGLLGTGRFGAEPSLWRAGAAVAVYGALTVIGLVVDRRALLVSALFYVLYAISALLRSAGDLSASLALTGLVVGSALLLLSAFWHPARRALLRRMPEGVRRRVPSV